MNLRCRVPLAQSLLSGELGESRISPHKPLGPLRTDPLSERAAPIRFTRREKAILRRTADRLTRLTGNKWILSDPGELSSELSERLELSLVCKPELMTVLTSPRQFLLTKYKDPDRPRLIGFYPLYSLLPIPEGWNGPQFCSTFAELRARIAEQLDIREPI